MRPNTNNIMQQCRSWRLLMPKQKSKTKIWANEAQNGEACSSYTQAIHEQESSKDKAPGTWHNQWPHPIHNRSSKIIKIRNLICTYNRHNYIIEIPSWIWLTHRFGWQILSLIVQQRLNMCKQLACMTDQVTDTKSGTQSGLDSPKPEGLSYCQILNW